MREPRLKLIDGAVHPAAHIAEQDRAGEAQLSLFDFRPVNRIVCFPMEDMHGSRFVRALDVLHPRAAVDLRPCPYFDLVTLDRARALDAMHRTTSRYIHLPLDLRLPRDQLGRWRTRQAVLDALAKLAAALTDRSNTIVFFVNNWAEIETLDQTVRQSDVGPAPVWKVEGLKEAVAVV
jgi:hypothetical protein